MASVLIVSFVEWPGAYQRPQHLATGLARRGWDATYASPGFIHRRGGRFASGLELPANLKVVQPAMLPGGSRSGAAAGINSWLMQRALRGLSKASWDAVIFNDPRWAEAAGSVPARRRVFDCMDDLSEAAPSAAWAARTDARAHAIADVLWTGTISLADRFAERGRKARFIPCGVDADFFANPKEVDVEAARKEAPAGDGPLAGYFGVLNERFDMECVEGLLDTGWRVLLIGPATSRAPRLPEHPRLRWIGPRPYASLPGYLAAFDIGLIPYRTDGPHRFLYPVKALEYLAGGKPVLATPLPDIVRLLGGAVELAEGKAAWRAAGERLLNPEAAVRERREAGRRIAFARSWGAMIDEMEQDLR